MCLYIFKQCKLSQRHFRVDGAGAASEESAMQTIKDDQDNDSLNFDMGMKARENIFLHCFTMRT